MLKPETQRLWDAIKDEKALTGFSLIGGTALTMHIGHRLSEDLNFAFHGGKLPRIRFEAIRRALNAKGFDLLANDSPQALVEFEDTGLDLLDYQRDFVSSNGVKVTFVAPDPECLAQLNPASPDGLRVATVEEIFRLKCIACANRSKSRDWLDVYLLLSSGAFTAMDMRLPFEAAKAPQKLSLALTRMCSGVVDAGDEGYESLLEADPSIEAMRTFFEGVRNEVEIESARRAWAAMAKS